MPMQPFTPTCNPIDPEGTTKLLDQLDQWFTHGGETTDALAILDQLATTAGTTFTAELTVHLAAIGLHELHQIEARRMAQVAA